MKRQTILKSTLCLLMALVCNVAWAQPEVSAAPENGQWAANTRWFQIKNQKNKVIRADVLTSEGYLALTNQNVIKSDVALWCIVGNGTNGYKFYNRAIGPSKVLGMMGSGAGASAVFVAEGTDGYRTAFDIVTSEDRGYWCMKDHGSDNNYWNQRDPRLAYWNNAEAKNGDDGSSFSFTEVDLSQEENATKDAITAAKDIIKVAPGYPKVSTAQYGMLIDLVNLDQVVVSDLTSAVTNYKTCSDIILPESRKAYTFALIQKGDDKEYKIGVDAQNNLSASASGTAATFYCYTFTSGSENRFVFISEEGKILAYKSVTENYTSSGNLVNDFTIGGMSSSSSTHISGEKSDCLGLIYLKAKARASNDNRAGCIICTVANNTFGNSTEPYYGKEGHTSAIKVTEVTGYTTNAAQNLAIAKIEAKLHVAANASKLGEGIGYAYYIANETKLSDVTQINTAIDAVTTVEAVNNIRNSFRFSIPEDGVLYSLYDETHNVYLDLHHLGVETNDQSFTQLATLNTERQLLYITANPIDGAWKIHTLPEGGDYLHQTSTRSWNSWVDNAGAEFYWQIDIAVENETIKYILKNTSGKNNGSLGAAHHANSTELYIGNTAGQELKLSLVEASVTPEEELDYFKMATKNALRTYTSKLRDQLGYYYCIMDGTKVYDVVTVNSKIDEAQSIEKIAEIADAVRNQHLILPEPGKAYKMAFKSTSSQLFYIKADDAAIDKSAVESDASIFFCLQSASDGYPFIFVSEDGKVLAYHETPASTLLNDYDSSGDRCNFKIEGMLEKTSNIKAGTEAIRLGTVCITAGKRASGNDTDGCFVFKSSANNYDKAPSAFFNDDFTSAIVFTEVENYVVPEAQQTKVDAILGKDAVKTQVEAIKNELKNQLGYYYCTINGEKYYDADAILALIDATQSLKTLNEISTAVTNKTLITPEVGKYYRIKGKISQKYIDATGITRGQMNMKIDTERGFLGSIFLLDDGNRLYNMEAEKYVYETHSIGADKNGANTWQFIFTNTGYFKLKSNYSSPWLHDDSNGKANRCQNDGDNHEFSLEEVPSNSLIIEAPGIVGATATWNGQTKSLPAKWSIVNGQQINTAFSFDCDNVNYTFEGLFENGVRIDEPTTIESLGADRIITAKFSPAFFSNSYGEKWVRLTNCSNTGYCATIDNAGTKGTTSKIDYADEKQLWCLVGTAENFVLYNKAKGGSSALYVPYPVNKTQYSNGDLAEFSDDENLTWKLKEQDFGYALVPTHNTNNSDLGVNMYGGAGGDLKLYTTGENNTGSYWLVDLVDVTNTLTLNVSVDQVWESSPRVAELTLTVNGVAGAMRILGNVEDQALYLPVGATYEVSSMTYRGYTYNGCTNDNGTLTASYTANDERTLFYSPRDGHPYRIPAIATAPNGDIFAICDYRPCGGDIGNGDVDIVCRISSDNGVTWGEELVLANGDGGSTNRMETGYGDPAIVVGRESNKILVMMVAGRTVCGNSRWDASKIGVKDAAAVNRAARIYGTLNESTGEWEWTQPEEVTDDIYKLFLDESNNATVTSYFIGSGKICQSRVVKKGEYYRLYCALWTRDQGNRVIYSDDFGGTWNVLGTINDRPASNGNEPKCEELPDGTVVLSSRVAGGRYFNLFTFADDTYTTGTWGEVANSTTARDGSSQGTNGEIYKVKAIRKEDGQICDVMLQSIPAGPGRSNVTVWYKEMDYTTAYTPAEFAADWKVGKQVSQKGSAYSTMHLQTDGRIGFFFEEEPGEYCMVYIPYTLEDLTDNKYSLYTVNSTITSHGIATFYATSAMQIPDGIKAYVATNAPVMNDGVGVITMEELEGIIPAKTGAVLRGEAKTYEFIPSISYGTPVVNNMMVGYEAANNKSDSMKEVDLQEVANKGDAIYFLTVKNGKAGFYAKTTGDFSVANNKAYLQIPKSMVSNARAIYFDFDDNTTAIESAFEDEATGVIYDLQGRQLKKATSNGIYIVNGKKVLK